MNVHTVSQIATIVAGGLVFLAAEWNGLSLISAYLHNPLTWLCMGLVTLLIPLLSRTLKTGNIWSGRAIVGMQVALILSAWATVQYPTFISLADGTNLTIFNTQSPPATFRQMTIALAIGIALIFPALFYLYRVFKTAA